MEINLEKLKKNFLTIKDIRCKITNVFNILEGHLLKLKTIYGEFVENNRQNLFIFGLDSFQFQSKLIDIEYDDMKRLFLAINNRMYCEYYKLYKIISEYVKENIIDKKTLDLIKITNNFTVYKDLEPYKQYNFDMTQEIHENIILLLYEINDYIIDKENELQSYRKKQDIGLNINNFVTTFNYTIIMIKEKSMLFISYIEFFHNLHTKYLQRFTMKMNLMFNQITHDIRFDDSQQNTDVKKKELLNNYKTENIDNSLIREIKRSFDDSESNNSEQSIKILLKDNEIDSPSNNKIKDLFKGNVKKIINSMRVFNKKKSSDNLSSVSSDSSLNDTMNNSQTNNNIKIIIEDKNNIKKSKSAEEIFIEKTKSAEEIFIEKTKSAEEIFIAISQQCEELTDTLNTQINDTNIKDINNNENKENSIKISDTDLIIKLDKDNEIIIENKIEDDSNKIEDDNLSIITSESHNEIQIEEQTEKIKEILPKKKKKYKPRKKNVE